MCRRIMKSGENQQKVKADLLIEYGISHWLVIINFITMEQVCFYLIYNT